MCPNATIEDFAQMSQSAPTFIVLVVSSFVLITLVISISIALAISIEKNSRIKKNNADKNSNMETKDASSQTSSKSDIKLRSEIRHSSAVGHSSSKRFVTSTELIPKECSDTSSEYFPPETLDNTTIDPCNEKDSLLMTDIERELLFLR